jgi:nucleoside-diphosphate-sugar epimerase
MVIALRPYELRFPAALATKLRDGGYRFIVTGARGWLGRASLDLLESALGAKVEERVVAFGSSPGVVKTRGGASVPVLRFDDAASLRRQPTLLMHYAYLTKDRLVGGLPVETYRRQNAEIRDTVRGWLEPLGITRIFLPSAGAVYSALGTVDDRDGRGDYGRDKLEDEAQFAAARKRLQARLLIARIFSVSGPHINKHDSYVLASIILSILRGQSIALRAQRPVYRSYVSVVDLITIAIGWLLRSDAPEQITIDAASHEIMEVGELAKRAALVLGARGATIQRPVVNMRDPDRYVGDPAQLMRLAAMLGVPLSNIDEQVRETAAYLAETAGARS